MHLFIVIYWFSVVDVFPGIRNQQQLPYDSETSNETNETDFHIPVDVTSEPVTQDHHDASTPHQLIIMYVCRMFCI